MPSRNVIKVNIPDSYYHVYARGRGKQEIFHDDQDYRTFLNLFKRHLSIEPVADNYGAPYIHLRGELELLCYCLMPNHFHILLFQKTEGAMSRLMRGIIMSYTRYYNKKYDSSGPLFETTYKASRISSDEYLLHISRYIHLNPTKWREYPYSSLRFYLHDTEPQWLQPSKVLDLHLSKRTYELFVEDYEEYKHTLDAIKRELAND